LIGIDNGQDSKYCGQKLDNIEVDGQLYYTAVVAVADIVGFVSPQVIMTHFSSEIVGIGIR